MIDPPFLPFRPPAWWTSFENEIPGPAPAPSAAMPVLRDGPPPMLVTGKDWWLR